MNTDKELITKITLEGDASGAKAVTEALNDSAVATEEQARNSELLGVKLAELQQRARGLAEEFPLVGGLKLALTLLDEFSGKMQALAKRPDENGGRGVGPGLGAGKDGTAAAPVVTPDGSPGILTGGGKLRQPEPASALGYDLSATPFERQEESTAGGGRDLEALRQKIRELEAQVARLAELQAQALGARNHTANLNAILRLLAMDQAAIEEVRKQLADQEARRANGRVFGGGQ